MPGTAVIMKRVQTPSMAKAIRAKCMDCSGNNMADVRKCPIQNCPLFPYRFGANPAAAVHKLEKSWKVKFID